MNEAVETLIWALVIGVASYRLWRLLGEDKITEGIRERLSSGIFGFVTCPWCFGSWVAIGLTGTAFLLGLFPGDVKGVFIFLLVAAFSATVVGLIGSRF